MLKNDRARGFLDGIMPHAQQGGVGELVNFAIGFLRRQYSVIIFVTALALAASAIYLRVTPPTYKGQVKVLFSNPKAQFVQQQSLLAEAPIDLAQLETQIEILRSKAIATSVIKQLNLTNDPEFGGSRLLLEPLWGAFWRWYGSPRVDPQVNNKEIPIDWLVAEFENRLSANRVGFSNIVEISFSASNPHRAAEIANAVADAYVTDKLNAKFDANRTATSWLQERLKELGQQALTAERAVNAFKSQNNIVSAVESSWTTSR